MTIDVALRKFQSSFRLPVRLEDANERIDEFFLSLG